MEIATEITRIRLPYKLPEFPPRTIWSSAHAREVWEPRVQAVAQAWLDVERQSVVAGLRTSALQSIRPEDLPQVTAQMAKSGLVVVPLGKVGNGPGYQSRSVDPAGGPWAYRCAITASDHAHVWVQAWKDGKDDVIGWLLGTPPCCREFFDRVWNQERWFDTTVPMSNGQRDHSPGVNMFWRWLGVRPVPHLPCSFGCPDSARMAAALLDLLPELERDWAREILSWPVLYTSLYGIAEIVTPVTRTSVPTDALAEKVEIRYHGPGYPEEGAQGLGFPFATPRATHRLILRPVGDPVDNGFSSRQAMNAAHNMLLAAIRGRTFDTVLDLGCGDGTLLSKIPARRRVGIEIDPERARRGGARLDRVVVGDCTDRALVAQIVAQEHPDLVVAQRDRNPPDTLPEVTVLSYSYEAGAEPPSVRTCVATPAGMCEN